LLPAPSNCGRWHKEKPENMSSTDQYLLLQSWEKNVKKRHGKERKEKGRINVISFGIFSSYCPKSYQARVQNINRTEKY
jgi:hypothetical protein